MIEEVMVRHANPVSGSDQSPSWEITPATLPAMDARHLLARNLKALMKAHKELNTLTKITAACGVSNGTLDRMRRAAAGARIDQVELVARAFGLEAWQMMVADLDPKNPPVLAVASDAERALYAKILQAAEQIVHYKTEP